MPGDEIGRTPSPKYVEVKNVNQSDASKSRWGELNGIYKMDGYLSRTYNGRNHASHFRYKKKWVDCASTNDTRAGDKVNNYFVTKCTGVGDTFYNCNSQDSHVDRKENWYVLQTDMDGNPTMRSGRHWWVKIGRNEAGTLITSTIEWLEQDGAYNNSFGNCPAASTITSDEFPGTWVMRSSQSQCCPDDDGRGIVYAYQIKAGEGESRPKYGVNAPCPKNGKWTPACLGSSTEDSFGNPCLTVNHNSPQVREIEIAWKIDYAPWTISMLPDAGGTPEQTVYSDGDAKYLTPIERNRQKILQTKMVLPDAVGVRTGFSKNTVWFKYGIEIETNWSDVNIFTNTMDRRIPISPDCLGPKTLEKLGEGLSWTDIIRHLKKNYPKLNTAKALAKMVRPECFGPTRKIWLPAEYEIIGLAGNDGKSVFFGKCVTIDGKPLMQWLIDNRMGPVNGTEWVRKLVKDGSGNYEWHYTSTGKPLPVIDIWKGPGRRPVGGSGNVPNSNSSFYFKEGEWKIIKRSGYPMIPQGLPGWCFVSKNIPIYYLNTSWNHTDADPIDPFHEPLAGAHFTADNTREHMKLRKAELFQIAGAKPWSIGLSSETNLQPHDGWTCDFMIRSKDPYNAENNFDVPSSQINPPNDTTPMWIRYWTAPEHVDVDNKIPDLPASQVPLAGQSGKQSPPVIHTATKDQWDEQQSKFHKDKNFRNC